VQLADHTDSLYVNVFNEVGLQLFGNVDAETLQNLKSSVSTSSSSSSS
jgi:hypothetical protein